MSVVFYRELDRATASGRRFPALTLNGSSTSASRVVNRAPPIADCAHDKQIAIACIELERVFAASSPEVQPASRPASDESVPQRCAGVETVQSYGAASSAVFGARSTYQGCSMSVGSMQGRTWLNSKSPISCLAVNKCM